MIRRFFTGTGFTSDLGYVELASGAEAHWFRSLQTARLKAVPFQDHL